mgnify:CR=1 FL=1
MEQFTEGESTREEIKNKLRQNFDGKIVRKDLTKKIKEGGGKLIPDGMSNPGQVYTVSRGEC